MDRSEVCDAFLDRLSFDPYPFQEEALLTWFDEGDGVLVTAPTGMGKTLIAEAAIFEALKTGQKLFYTTPLIALTDQKFREFQDKAESWGFQRDQIGLMTGNRKVNPDAPVRIVVAEILLNHLLAHDPSIDEVMGVVMDEFHSFNDRERGIVWELTLVLLPKRARLMLLSATVGNTREFLSWLDREHGRTPKWVHTDTRRVPLTFIWIGDKLLTEHLPQMTSDNDEDNRTPALVFCFNRDECWEVAERIKGVSLIDQATRKKIEEQIDPADFAEGGGPKLRQMLIRGVGVHHAGILPKHKEVVESLFLQKLIPFVICTETLAAGINLPARSVVLSTLLKGKKGDKKLVPSSSAHQMFGRAGRPQFDKEGYVFALAHEDDVKIDKWRKKYDQIDPNSKDPGIMRARKQLERKKPSRRKTVQYWGEGQFKVLQESGPAKLYSHSMIPYAVLIYLLTVRGSLAEVRAFLSKRLNTMERLAKFQDQLDHMIANLEAFGYLKRSEDGDHVTLDSSIEELKAFRSVDPLYGAFAAKHLIRSSYEEKVQALDSMMIVPPNVQYHVHLADDIEPGPLQSGLLQPELLKRGVLIVHPEGKLVEAAPEDEYEDHWDDGYEHVFGVTMPQMLKLYFDEHLASPEAVSVQPKWILGEIIERDADFHKFIKAHTLEKNEGLILRHLLRLVILTGEFKAMYPDDPDYDRMGEIATRACQMVDASYTDRFLAAEEEAKQLAQQLQE